jgi:uncharacterized membrane protein YfhO
MTHPFLKNELECLGKAYDCVLNNRPIEENMTAIKKKSVVITGNSLQMSGTKFLSIDGNIFFPLKIPKVISLDRGIKRTSLQRALGLVLVITVQVIIRGSLR